jgi:hypothetical protein
MGAAGGPNAASSGLVFAADAFNRKGISPLGNDLFNTAPSVIKNIVSPSEGVQQINGVYVGNLNYYTAFAIDYPEGNYGGDAANRNGIAAGLNVRGGGMTFSFGRALNYAVYDNITQAWVKTTVYDSYVGTAAVDTFVSEYAATISAYPDAVHIVAGSHRDSNHTTAQYNILRDLGAPSNVDAIIGFSSPEWILVGKPGLGAGNAYGWVFQNYPTNSDFVAHLNFGLPIYGTKDNYFRFDGTNDYVVINSFANQPTTQITCEAWIKPTKGSVGGTQRGGAISAGNSMYLGIIDSIDGGNTFAMHWANQTTDSRLYNWNGSIPNNAWTHIAGTYNGSTSRAYVNGVEISSWAQTGNIPSSTYYLGTYGYTLGDGSHNFQGQISNAKIYNRGLSGAEILQNYQALRKRFNV